MKQPVIGKAPDWTGLAAFITGGGSGIGRATAHALAREGAAVIVADLNGPAAAGVAAELRLAGHTAQALAMDVADEAAWEAALHAWPEGWPPLRVLVNAAGVSAAAPVAETAFADWRRLHSVNLDGVFLGTRAGLRIMRGRGGVIVNVASRSGVDVFPGAAAYSAGKAAVIHFSLVADAECLAAGHGVRVLHVAPGGVKTPLWHSLPGWAELARDGEEAAWRALDPSNEFLTAAEAAGLILKVINEAG